MSLNLVPPSVTGELKVTILGLKAQLTWEAVTMPTIWPITGYDISVMCEGSNWSVLQTVLQSEGDISYTTEPLEGNKRYRFAVAAANEVGAGSRLESADVTITGTPGVNLYIW